MDKKELIISHKTKRNIPKGYPWRRGDTFFDRDIRPLIRYLQSNANQSLQVPIKNYLIIRLVSILEDFFKALVVNMVNDYDLPLSILWKKYVDIPVGILNEMLSKKNPEPLTKGKIVANEFNFADPKIVNDIFTALLRSDQKFRDTGEGFFSTIRKIDWYDPLQIFKGAVSLNKNWDNFERMFTLRNDIIHGMKDSDLSVKQVVSLAANSLNVMEAAAFLGLMSEMDKIVGIIKIRKSKRDEIRETFGQYRRKTR